MKPIPKLIWINEADSTNRVAHDLINDSNEIEEGTAIMSKYQTAGKGQKGNIWESDRGKNMLVSVILKPEFLEASKMNLINQAVAISVCEHLFHQTGLDFKVKWPNDILYQERKVGGILIENSIRGNKCNYSIVGVGINLNQIAFKSYHPRATSLKLITGKDIESVQDFTIAWRQNLLKKIELLRMNGEATISNAYFQKLFGLNEIRYFETEGVAFKGVIRGIDESGALLVETSEGQLRFAMKEVKYLFND